VLGRLRVDYCLANRPFGVEWKKVEKEVRDEAEKEGHHGRFGAGLPRVSDGSLLFLMHLLSKLRRPSEGGGRIGIVLNGSPLFTGGAGFAKSDIRKWIIKNDWLEAIGLPTDMILRVGASYRRHLRTPLSGDNEKCDTAHLNLVDSWRAFESLRDPNCPLLSMKGP
jgi:type I restriction-modification system DNA methylase subunit